MVKFMATEFSLEKYRVKKRKALFKIFIFSIIEFICLNIYIIFSAIYREYDWPIERLTTSIEGFVIQILGLIAIISGIYIFIQVMVYIALFLTTPDISDEF